jgi:hypothetical protein
MTKLFTGGEYAAILAAQVAVMAMIELDRYIDRLCKIDPPKDGYGTHIDRKGKGAAK